VSAKTTPAKVPAPKPAPQIRISVLPSLACRYRLFPPSPIAAAARPIQPHHSALVGENMKERRTGRAASTARRAKEKQITRAGVDEATR
jgi:hypothetical protein